MCLLMFRGKQNDLDLMDNLAADLGFSNRHEFTMFMNTHKDIITTKRGRPMSGQVGRQAAYDFWKDVSNISNDRRNARHVAKSNHQS